MKKTLLALLAGAVACGALSAKSLAPPKRAELERLVAASEVVAIASVTAGPEKTRVELTEVLFAMRDATKKGAVVEVERAKPNDGAHPAISVLVFFPTFPPKAAEFTGILFGPDTVRSVKDIIAKKKANQMPEPTPGGVAHR